VARKPALCQLISWFSLIDGSGSVTPALELCATRGAVSYHVFWWKGVTALHPQLS